jgi:glycosyltransferase involved in cell wall biosynthesis
MDKHAIGVSTISSCFRGERYLPRFLANVAEQSIFERTELVLVLNEPSECETEIVGDFQGRYPGHLQQIVVNPAEPVAASWNRSWCAAHGHYVCIWNVDDVRTPESLLRQRDALDNNPDVALVYGDFVIVSDFGSTEGRHVDAPDFEGEEFTRSCHLGPFPMWRKEIGQRVGFFDEQFRSGVDFEFAVRVALNFRMRKVPGLLGYFTDAGAGLSTGSPLQPIERTVVELRYGIYDKVDRAYIADAQKYNIKQIRFGATWHPVDRFVPHYDELLLARERLRGIGRRRHIARQL